MLPRLFETTASWTIGSAMKLLPDYLFLDLVSFLSHAVNIVLHL